MDEQINEFNLGDEGTEFEYELIHDDLYDDIFDDVDLSLYDDWEEEEDV